MRLWPAPEEIRPNGDPYLTRWRLIETPWFGVYLHRFVAGDPEPYTLHNHPWEGFSYVFGRGYLEGRAEGPPGDLLGMIAWRFVRGVNRIHRNTYHRVELLDERRPVWSLLVRGRRYHRRRVLYGGPHGPVRDLVPDWGFVVPPQWRSAREAYLRAVKYVEREL
jgi:hypothetical protein